MTISVAIKGFYIRGYCTGGFKAITMLFCEHSIPGYYNPKGPSAQIVGFQGPKTIPSMDFGT